MKTKKRRAIVNGGRNSKAFVLCAAGVRPNSHHPVPCKRKAAQNAAVTRADKETTLATNNKK